MSEFEADRLAHQALIEEFNQLESNHNLSTLSVETSNESGYFTSSSELDKTDSFYHFGGTFSDGLF